VLLTFVRAGAGGVWRQPERIPATRPLCGSMNDAHGTLSAMPPYQPPQLPGL